MKIFDRYILKESAAFFFLSLFAFTGVLLTIRMLRFASLIVDKGVEFSQIGQVFIAIIPTFLEIAIPLATLLGIMLAFARFSGDSEIVVMRASGVSLYRLVVPVVFFGIFAGIAGMIVSHELKPWGYQKLSQSLFEIARSKSTSGLEPGIFNKLGPLTLYAEKIDYQTGALEHVLIDDRREKDLRKIVISDTGSIVSDADQRSITLELHQGTIHEVVQGKYTLTKFITNSLVLDPDELFESGESKRGKQSNEMYIPELRERLVYLQQLNHIAPNEGALKAEEFPEPVPSHMVKENITHDEIKKRIRRTKTEIGQRFSLPFAAFALALLALPLGIQPSRAQRTWGIGLSALLGLSAFVVYYGTFSIGLVLAQNGTITPIAALWTPNILVFLAALFMIHKTGSEKWQSIAHGVELSWSAIMRTILRAKPA